MKTSRRNLLKALTLYGSAATVAKLPETWSRPVVESVIAPAHAQASECVIRIEFEILASEFSAGFILYDETTCYHNTGALTEGVALSFPLGPGTYYFDGVGSSNGFLSLGVTCCDDMEEVSGSSVLLTLIITIGDDGTCSVVLREGEPPFPDPCT